MEQLKGGPPWASSSCAEACAVASCPRLPIICLDEPNQWPSGRASRWVTARRSPSWFTSSAVFGDVLGWLSYRKASSPCPQSPLPQAQRRRPRQHRPPARCRGTPMLRYQSPAGCRFTTRVRLCWGVRVSDREPPAVRPCWYCGMTGSSKCLASNDKTAPHASPIARGRQCEYAAMWKSRELRAEADKLYAKARDTENLDQRLRIVLRALELD